MRRGGGGGGGERKGWRGRGREKGGREVNQKSSLAEHNLSVYMHSQLLFPLTDTLDQTTAASSHEYF